MDGGKYMMDEARRAPSPRRHSQKFRASQIFIKESCLRAPLLRPVCQQPIDNRAADESGRISPFTLVTQTRSQRLAADELSVWAGDWQPGELVAARWLCHPPPIIPVTSLVEEMGRMVARRQTPSLDLWGYKLLIWNDCRCRI